MGLQRTWRQGLSWRRKLAQLKNDAHDTAAEWIPKEEHSLAEEQIVHFVLDDVDQSNALIKSDPMMNLLSRSPKFIPTPKTISAPTIRQDISCLRWRLMKTFKGHIYRDFIDSKRKLEERVGIRPWIPKQFSMNTEQLDSEVSLFFKYDGWIRNSMSCPDLQGFLNQVGPELRRSVNFSGVRFQKNLNYEEGQMLNLLKENPQLKLGVADKNLGPVLYSASKAREQCLLHLKDEIGTYEEVHDDPKAVLMTTLEELKMLLSKHCKQEGLHGVRHKILDWAQRSVAAEKICKFYILWKLHKAPNTRGVMSRPIAPSCGYLTAQASHFLHSQLVHAVYRHPFVLKDSLTLCSILDDVKVPDFGNFFLDTADVVALYPSIRLDKGLEALAWFLVEFSDVPRSLHNFIIDLAKLVLEKNYVTCEYLDETKIFLQKIGTAMGTSFSVVYAVIFMLWVETPIVERFAHCLRLYKRFIDDLFVIWTGSIQELCDFRAAFDERAEGIKLEWAVSVRDPFDLGQFRHADHTKAVFLDLDIRIIQCDHFRRAIEFKVYGKPKNAYAYIPFDSFHVRHIFKGWIKAELIRITTHCSTKELWKKELQAFYYRLRKRNYPKAFITVAFQTVRWSLRKSYILRENNSSRKKQLTTTKRVVFSTAFRPGFSLFRKRMNLKLGQLNSEGNNIFPEEIFIAHKSAPRLGHLVKK